MNLEVTKNMLKEQMKIVDELNNLNMPNLLNTLKRATEQIEWLKNENRCLKNWKTRYQKKCLLYEKNDRKVKTIAVDEVVRFLIDNDYLDFENAEGESGEILNEYDEQEFYEAMISYIVDIPVNEEILIDVMYKHIKKEENKK